MASTSDKWVSSAPGMLRTAFLTFLHVACADPSAQRETVLGFVRKPNSWHVDKAI